MHERIVWVTISFTTGRVFFFLFGDTNNMTVCFQNIVSYPDHLFVFLSQHVGNALMPDVLKNLFEQCNAKNPKNRPHMSDVAKTLSVSI